MLNDIKFLYFTQICDEYQKIAGCSLKDSIRKEFSGDIEVSRVAAVIKPNVTY